MPKLFVPCRVTSGPTANLWVITWFWVRLICLWNEFHYDLLAWRWSFQGRCELNVLYQCADPQKLG